MPKSPAMRVEGVDVYGREARFENERARFPKGIEWNAVKDRGCPRNCNRRASVQSATEA